MGSGVVLGRTGLMREVGFVAPEDDNITIPSWLPHSLKEPQSHAAAYMHVHCLVSELSHLCEFD